MSKKVDNNPNLQITEHENRLTKRERNNISTTFLGMINRENDVNRLVHKQQGNEENSFYGS